MPCSDQVVAPIWEEGRPSGMTEEQIDAMFRSKLVQPRRERMERRGME